MARLERFELPTPWFVARCSIQMSYRRLKTEKWSTERESNSREVSLSDLQSDAFDRLATCACEKLVPQVGLEPTRPKALVSKTSAAAITPPGQNILENDK